jgi:DNA repair exonuclease SbcCD ATPase subunit
MKTKAAIIVLVLALLALAIGLFATKQQSDTLHTADVNSIVSFSNQLVETTGQLGELRQVNLDLTNDLTMTRSQLTVAEEKINSLSNNLINVEVTLENTSALLAIAQNQITNLNVKMTDLQWHNKTLEQNAQELTATIAQLNVTIADTEKRLAKETKNRAYLEKELSKQIALRNELESKFNNLAEVRAQIRKLRDERIATDRIAALKDPTVGKKGSELLMMQSTAQVLAGAATKTATNSVTPRKTAAPDYNLNVEVGNDGSVKVIPPLNNAPKSK